MNGCRESDNGRTTAGQPVILVDTKKQELIGDYKTGGSDYRATGCPDKVRAHDFLDPDLGKVAPYGVSRPRPEPGTLARFGVRDSKTPMIPDRTESIPVPSDVPAILVSWLGAFRPCFSGRVWNHILVLVAGAVLAPGKRTLTQSLRVMGVALYLTLRLRSTVFQRFPHLT